MLSMLTASRVPVCEVSVNAYGAGPQWEAGGRELNMCTTMQCGQLTVNPSCKRIGDSGGQRFDSIRFFLKGNIIYMQEMLL